MVCSRVITVLVGFFSRLGAIVPLCIVQTNEIAAGVEKREKERKSGSENFYCHKTLGKSQRDFQKWPPLALKISKNGQATIFFL